MIDPSLGSDDGLDVRVVRKEFAADGVLNIELWAVDGGPLPAFTAGSHIDVELPVGVIRQYSLCNPPTETHRYELGVLLEPDGRGGSRSAHEDLRVGQTVRISKPRNQFPLVEATHVVLAAGGIGVTPLLSMAAELAKQGRSFELHYCSRSVDRTAFLPRLRKAAYANRVHFHFDDGGWEQRFDAARTLASAPPDSRLYVCGPKGFMEHVTGIADAIGWVPERIHLEHFVGAETVPSDGESFEVELASTGQVVRVGPEQTVVQALAENGIQVPLSCEQGICGTCAMRVIDGEPDHRDMHFTPEEHAANRSFTPCCSRAKSSRLVIDFQPPG